MMFSDLTKALREIDDSSLVGRRDLTKDLLSSLPPSALPGVVTILAGGKELGKQLPRGTLIRAISRASGYSRARVEEVLRVSSGLPEATEVLMAGRPQMSPPEEKQRIDRILTELEGVMNPRLGRRYALLRLTKLLSLCRPSSARIIVAICSGESRPYTADSVLLDVVAELEGEDIENLRHRIEKLGWRRGLE